MSTTTKALAFVAAGMATGSVALVTLFELVGSYEDAIELASADEDEVLAVGAARDLYQGVQITEEDLYAVQIPARYLPEGVFLTPEFVVGRIPRERILANEFVRATRLSDPDIGQGLNAMIPRGMRAISLQIGDGAALQGLLHPGSYVDVLTTLEGTSGEVETRTLLQGMFVLGVDSRLRQESRDDAEAQRGRTRPSVTLLASADQAEVLAHADLLAEVHLSLRGGGEFGVVPLNDSVTLDDLFGPKEPVRITPVSQPVRQTCAFSTDLVLGGVKVKKWYHLDGTPCDAEVPRRGGSR